MSTVDTLRKHCSSLCAEREKNLQSTLSEYFESAFIGKHKPFRAIIGNKRCKPIPIYRDFAFSIQESYGFKLVWPNFSEETLRKELSNLGFIITENKISISVPSHKKGEKPTFAQEWVKKINHSYSVYCANEKKLAEELYPDVINKLHSTPAENIITYDGYTLFQNFRYERSISRKCATFIRRLMVRDGIKECFENGEYKGMMVLKHTPN